MTPADDDQIISRYSRLARAALRGGDISDGDPDDVADGGFGAWTPAPT